MKILVGIIILAIVLYAVIIIYQQYLIQQIKALSDSRSEIDPVKLLKDISKIKTMTVSGSTLDQMNQLDSDYSNLIDNRLPFISMKLKEANDKVKRYHLFQATTNKNKATLSLRDTKQFIKQLRKNMIQLQKTNEQHKEAAVILQQQYRELKKNFLDNSFLYADSVDALNKKLDVLEHDNKQFSVLINLGDYEKTNKMMSELQQNTDHLRELIDNISPLYRTLIEEFPSQISEIKDCLKMLNKAGYKFPENDLDKQITQLNHDINMAHEALAQLELNEAIILNKQLECSIEHLYSVMEKEMVAKPKMESNIDTLFKVITHAENKNNNLVKKLNRLIQNYTLDNNEQIAARNFTIQLKKIEKQYNNDIMSIYENNAIFSEMFDRQEKQLDDIKKVEVQQQKISDAVAGLVEEEKKSLQTLQQFDFEIHAIHRRVSNLNLPGLDKEYTDYFQVVSAKIEHLNRGIKQPQIDMEEIKKQLRIIQSNLDILQKKTSSLIDNSQLAEKLIQYANRYRMSHKDVASSREEAKQLFNEVFNYTKSLEIIATKIDQVEPGAYKRLSDNYYRSKKKHQDNIPFDGM